MATNAQIFEMRLSLKDPAGFISIIEVADEAARPASPIAQTLYFITAINEYHAFEEGEWARQDVEMGNDRVGLFIDLYGVAKARYYIVKEYIRSLGQKLYLAQHDNGSESFTFQSITAMLTFYKGILADLNEEIAIEAGANTGRYVRTKRQRVGGMLGPDC